MFAAELDTKKKLELLEEIFSDPVWGDTLRRDADPIFRNLAARKEFISDIKNKVLLLPEIGEYTAEKERLFEHFDIV